MRKRKNGRRSSAWIRPEKRHAIYHRHGWRCTWCGGDVGCDPVLDHLFHRGHAQRTNDARFVVTSCRSCNAKRKHTSVAVFLRGLCPDDRWYAVQRLALRRCPLNMFAGRAALARSRDLWKPLLPPPAPYAHMLDDNGVVW